MGRAVYHDNELTYCIVIPESSELYKLKNLDLYKELSGGILAGLKLLGIEAKIQRPHDRKSQYQDKANCFAATSAYEITVNGGKIVGSA